MAEALALPSARDLALVYRRMVAARIRSEWQYRTAFVITTVLQLFATGFGFLMIAVLFSNVPRVGGWALAEVGLLYGLSSTSFNLADTFISQVEMATVHIREGTFDRFLLRPAPPMMQLCASEFAYRRLNKIVQAIVVLVGSALAVDVSWSAPRILALVGAIASGAAIFGGLWVIYCSLSFWTVNTSEFVYAAVTGGEVASRYPQDVFQPALRRGLVAIVPIAFCAYLPTCWLLGRTPADGYAPAIAFASPAIATAVALLARFVWGRGLRRYQGTGS